MTEGKATEKNEKNGEAGGGNADALRGDVPAGGDGPEPGMGRDPMPGGRV
jgi:hypothetical protein